MHAQPSGPLGDYIRSLPRPSSKADFVPLPHLSPQDQDTTLICWSFATSSFLESEMQRLGRTPVRLSVLYPLYCVYQEKARRFIATRGASRFAPGDLFTGILEIIRQYGAMPAEVYGGKEQGRTTFNHNALYAELDLLMKRVKGQQIWDEPRVLGEVRRILDQRLGPPPAEFIVEGTRHTPVSFARDVIALPWDDYVLLTSFQYAPFGRFIELTVPDNWQHRQVYYNVPLDTFARALSGALDRGYSVAIDADISEPGYEQGHPYVVIPPWDAPPDSITQEAREGRFRSGATTDDHLMQVVGRRTFGDQEWFLVKDSWRTAYRGQEEGYMFFHASYVRLKVLAMLVHRGAVAGLGIPASPR